MGKIKDWDAKSRSTSQKSTTLCSEVSYELPQVKSLSPRAPKGLSEVGASGDRGSSRVGFGNPEQEPLGVR